MSATEMADGRPRLLTRLHFIPARQAVTVILACLLLPGCAAERWQLSTVPRKPDFEIRNAQELFSGQGRHRGATNELVYVEPGANLVDYAYDTAKHEIEITVEVNRDHTITVAGPRAGLGKQIKLLNYEWLSRAIRLKDSTGSVRIGSTVALPPRQNSLEEHALTLLLGLLIDDADAATGEASLRPELSATLQSLVVYDHDQNLILAEWTRRAEPGRAPAPEEPATSH